MQHGNSFDLQVTYSIALSVPGFESRFLQSSALALVQLVGHERNSIESSQKTSHDFMTHHKIQWSLEHAHGIRRTAG
jgi:hypothetical protein